MQLFVAALNAETNFWSPVPTGYGAFQFRSAANPDGGDFAAALDAIYDVAGQSGCTIIEGPCGAAQPFGPLTASAWVQVRDGLLESLDAALPVDAVVLLLHGAMSAEGCDDCEGAILEAVRQRVGPTVPIGVELDPHCHLTIQMRTNANIILAYKEYPHTDIAEQARKLVELTLQTAHGLVRPALAVAECPIMGLFPTTREPMKRLVEKMRQLESQEGVLAVSFGHGFAYGDVAEAGSKVWVVTDGSQAKAEGYARELALEIYALRDQISLRFTPLNEAISQIEAWHGTWPLVLADVADNPGGGARGDSTFILAAMLEAQLSNIAIGGIWDPGAVQICLEAGVGARLTLRIGGKSGSASGNPIDITGRIMSVRPAHSQTEFGVVAPLGAAAWLRSDEGLDLVVMSRCQQVLGMDLFTGLGLNLTDKRAIVVKSMQHFTASFSALSQDVVYVDTPGLLRTDFENIQFMRRDLNFWPRLADPLQAKPL